MICLPRGDFGRLHHAFALFVRMAPFIKPKEKIITGAAGGMNETCVMFRAMPGINRRSKNALLLADAPNFDERLKASLMAQS
jgi:hypothetical protein